MNMRWTATSLGTQETVAEEGVLIPPPPRTYDDPPWLMPGWQLHTHAVSNGTRRRFSMDDIVLWPERPSLSARIHPDYPQAHAEQIAEIPKYLHVNANFLDWALWADDMVGRGIRYRDEGIRSIVFMGTRFVGPSTPGFAFHDDGTTIEHDVTVPVVIPGCPRMYRTLEVTGTCEFVHAYKSGPFDLGPRDKIALWRH